MRARLVLPTIAGAKGALVEIEGVDISNAVRRVSLEASATDLTELRIDLGVVVDVTLEGEVRVFMSNEARDALIHLGWTPPAGA